MTDLAQRYHFADFTRENYRRLLILAQQSYSFRGFTDFDRNENFILWRHDVDYSMHAALALARIEADLGIQATYFLLPGSAFYNLFESSIAKCTQEIRQLGHSFGLHFDASRYAIASSQDLELALKHEQQWLADYCTQPISAFSFHNPTAVTLAFNQQTYAGMVNTYARYFRDDIAYCSDSNGIWRHHRLEEVLGQSKPVRLQVLTHPAWWTEFAQSPRERIYACIAGRARHVLSEYNQALNRDQRVNVVTLAAEFEALEACLGARALTVQMLWLEGERPLAYIQLWRLFGQHCGASFASVEHRQHGGLENWQRWRALRDHVVQGLGAEEDVLGEGMAFVIKQLVHLAAQRAQS